MNKAVRKLFDDYYEFGHNISVVDELMWTAKKLKLSVPEEGDIMWQGGITDAELENLLNDPSAGKEEVLREDATAKKMGIAGLPHFEMKGQKALIGAQSTESWIILFEKELSRHARLG